MPLRKCLHLAWRVLKKKAIESECIPNTHTHWTTDGNLLSSGWGSLPQKERPAASQGGKLKTGVFLAPASGSLSRPYAPVPPCYIVSPRLSYPCSWLLGDRNYSTIVEYLKAGIDPRYFQDSREDADHCVGSGEVAVWTAGTLRRGREHRWRWWWRWPVLELFLSSSLQAKKKKVSVNWISISVSFSHFRWKLLSTKTISLSVCLFFSFPTAGTSKCRLS